jgi:hypothetical protein
MNRLRYTVEIERLILTDLDLTPVQAEQVRSRLAGELQAALAGRHWVGNAADLDVEHLVLPTLSLGKAPGAGPLARALAGRIARALPGRGEAGPRRADDG